CAAAKEYFKENSHHWSWAVQWLQKKDTLAYATALLNERDQSGSSNGSKSSPANENGDRSMQQGPDSPMIIGDPKSDLDDVDP
ncbi:hypothetical protein AB205_0118910, partial [Aquarana catesbeiana]